MLHWGLQVQQQICILVLDRCLQEVHLTFPFRSLTHRRSRGERELMSTSILIRPFTSIPQNMVPRDMDGGSAWNQIFLLSNQGLLRRLRMPGLLWSMLLLWNMFMLLG